MYKLTTIDFYLFYCTLPHPMQRPSWLSRSLCFSTIPDLIWCCLSYIYDTLLWQTQLAIGLHCALSQIRSFLNNHNKTLWIFLSTFSYYKLVYITMHASWIYDFVFFWKCLYGSYDVDANDSVTCRITCRGL